MGAFTTVLTPVSLSMQTAMTYVCLPQLGLFWDPSVCHRRLRIFLSRERRVRRKAAVLMDDNTSIKEHLSHPASLPPTKYLSLGHEERKKKKTRLWADSMRVRNRMCRDEYYHGLEQRKGHSGGLVILNYRHLFLFLSNGVLRPGRRPVHSASVSEACPTWHNCP